MLTELDYSFTMNSAVRSPGLRLLWDRGGSEFWAGAIQQV